MTVENVFIFIRSSWTLLHDVYEMKNNVHDLLKLMVILFDYMEERWSARMDNMVFTVILPNALIQIIHPCTPKIVPFDITPLTVENDAKLKRHDINVFPRVIWAKPWFCCIYSHQLSRSFRTKLSFCSQIHSLYHSYFQLNPSTYLLARHYLHRTKDLLRFGKSKKK